MTKVLQGTEQKTNNLKRWGNAGVTLRDRWDLVVLRLSPTLVRPFGHAVHRAPDAERNQHPG